MVPPTRWERPHDQAGDQLSGQETVAAREPAATPAQEKPAQEKPAREKSAQEKSAAGRFDGDGFYSLRERIRDTHWRRRLARRRTVDHTYRVGVGVFGGLIVSLGIVTIPLPGPGWLTVIAGLFVLATEFTWAERLLEFTKKHVRRWTDWVTAQPLWVRGLIALATAAFVYGVLVVTLHVTGVPDWVPGWVPLWR
jgi:uncharacterized protein (TIGR02611 family)